MFSSGKQIATCFRCTGGWVDEEAYAYLLGAYLGDGWIWNAPKDVYQLRISCDLRYPDIIDEIASHVVIVRGVEKVGFSLQEGCVEVYAYWKHWPCVFPQHGPGRKHERRIQLESWQSQIVAAHPKALVRGLDPFRRQPARQPDHETIAVRSSSTIGIRGTCSRTPPPTSWPSSPTHSTCSECIGHRPSPRDISIARRPDVAFLDTFIGPKR